MAHHIFQLETELQNIPEKLARYGSSALSGMEHLRLLVTHMQRRCCGILVLLRHCLSGVWLSLTL